MQKLAKFLILVLVCFLFIGLGCKKKDVTPTETATTQANTVLSSDDATIKSTFEKNLETAKNKVSWDNQAKWVALNVQIDGDLLQGSVFETYIFNLNPSHPIYKYYYSTINFADTGKFLRALVNKEDYFTELPNSPQEISTNYLKVTWLEALKKAESSGGKDFRDKNPNNVSIDLNMYRGEPNNYSYWYVLYKQVNGTDSIQVQIDANSGQIINSSNQTQTQTDQNPELAPSSDSSSL